MHDYFSYDDIKNISKCRCERKFASGAEICGFPIKGKNPTNLRTHLESFHKTEFKVVVQKEEENDEEAARIDAIRSMNSRKHFCATAAKKKQQKMDGFITAGSNCLYPESSVKYANKLQAVVKLFALTTLPTTLLNGDTFREFFAVMDPQFKPPGNFSFLFIHFHTLFCYSLYMYFC